MDKEALINLKNNMNPSQFALFQRLAEILPTMDEREIIEELLAMHVLGISEKIRIERILAHVGINKEVTIEDKVA